MMRTMLALTCCCFLLTAKANAALPDTVEEQRLEAAWQLMPQVLSRFEPLVNNLRLELQHTETSHDLAPRLRQHGEQLWYQATYQARTNPNYDDRALYWARLMMTQSVRQWCASQSCSQLAILLEALELSSRGQLSIRFAKDSDVRILLTGFDPFLLDRNLNQSNPSGVTALMLDGWVFQQDGRQIEVQTAMIPVRFADFDQGMIEQLLRPLLQEQSVDLLLTVSMGREHFDLEHFPGRRRSAEAPDNLNVYTGGNADNPVLPLLDGKPLAGPEFVAYSLPYTAMMQAEGRFNINDNRSVTTLERGEFAAQSLAELADQTAVQGGGGYLSNEISYRSILLRDRYAPALPVGHIHTPRIAAFEPDTTAAIVGQIKAMIRLAVASTPAIAEPDSGK
ncbi:hypothetical protein Q3O59_08690 [Alkalimonas delamerensis]|uniref:Pyrrolidone-carboxylate peptidase (N-terminal pyroglutamyl peptidase) n=1 Tax=Alkalimonas delamerensis TaxID=265981 RepID=A0ABT9GQP2_9GAMM|nr:hypothetical protein [Alkalimonas delamerensis]MDP4529105.1 hypothetical protein [Alkalimonas delamerensis]